MQKQSSECTEHLTFRSAVSGLGIQVLALSLFSFLPHDGNICNRVVIDRAEPDDAVVSFMKAAAALMSSSFSTMIQKHCMVTSAVQKKRYKAFTNNPEQQERAHEPSYIHTYFRVKRFDGSSSLYITLLASTLCINDTFQ